MGRPLTGRIVWHMQRCKIVLELKWWELLNQVNYSNYYFKNLYHMTSIQGYLFWYRCYRKYSVIFHMEYCAVFHVNVCV